MSGASLLLRLVLKLENELPVWTEAIKCGPTLKSWTWDYIGRPACPLEITWGCTGRFESWYWKKWMLMDFNLKMKEKD